MAMRMPILYSNWNLDKVGLTLRSCQASSDYSSAAPEIAFPPLKIKRDQMNAFSLRQENAADVSTRPCNGVG